MKRLIIADIHANLPAFEAVLNDAGHFDEVIFLGDVLMYGPNPVECVELLKSINAKSIIGNHEREVFDLIGSGNIDIFKNWATWTYYQLSEKHLNYLQNWPNELNINIAGKNTKCIHALTYVEYLVPTMDDAKLYNYMKQYDEELLICGHTHRLNDRGINNKRLISVYAVGQPKDGNYQAGYTIEEDGIFTHKRVDYDVEKYEYDFRKIAFDEVYKERWFNFIKTGYDSEWIG